MGVIILIGCILATFFIVYSIALAMQVIEEFLNRLKSRNRVLNMVVNVCKYISYTLLILFAIGFFGYISSLI